MMTRLYRLLLLCLLLQVQKVFSNVSMFGCERFSGTSLTRVDTVLGETCAESINVGIDYTQTGTEIIDGRTLLLDRDVDCCTLCRTTPGCKTWTRFVESNSNNRPQGSCWLSSAVPVQAREVASKQIVHSGIVSPAVMDPTTCLARRYIGYNDPNYNDPDLLKTQSEDACCLRCQEQQPICQAWVYDQRDQSCRLYATNPENAYICRTCISGTIGQLDEVLDATVERVLEESCGTGDSAGNEGFVYRGSAISPEGAFQTDTSARCCRFCGLIRECRSWTWLSETQVCTLFGDLPSRRWRGQDEDRSGVSAPKVCESVECAVNEGVDLSAAVDPQDQASESLSQNFAAANKEECCLRCQEIPDCRAWTYFSSKMLCWTISHPSMDIHSCSDCSSSILAFRYATRADKDELKKTMSDISALLGGRDVAVTRGTELETFTTVEGQDNNSNSVSLGLIFGIAAGFLGLLIIIPVAWQCLAWRRHKRIQAGRKKIDASSHSQSSFGVSGTSMSPLGGGGEAPLSISSETTAPVSNEERQEILAEATRTEIKSAAPPLSAKQASLLRGLLQESRQKESYFQFRSASSFKQPGQDSLHAVLNLVQGFVVAGKYEIEHGTRIGQNNAIVRAHMTFGQTTPVVLKFFRAKTEFDRESSFYSDSISSNFLPDVLDIYNGSANEALGMPALPCIVLERGDSSLEDWLNKQSRMLDPMDQRSILYKISRGVQFLHERLIVHRDLKPGNIVVFALNFSLKLIDLGSACRKGEPAAIEYTLRYAAPEVVSAHLSNAADIIAHPSADQWSLGLIFWEVLVGEPLFGSKYTEEEVMAMLVGLSPFPFDKDPEIWNTISSKVAQRLVQGLLRRNPDARWPIQKVVSNAYFASGSDTMAQEESVEAMGRHLQQIAEGVNTIRQGLFRLEELSVENLKMSAASALLACFSFVEIDSSEVDPGKEVNGQFLVEKYTRDQLKCEDAYLEPNYNIFRRQNEDPVSLLRIGKKHLIRVSMMTAGETKITVPIAELLWMRISPTGVQKDTLEADFSLRKNEGHVIEGVGFWNTDAHRDLSLKLAGKASVDVVVGFKLKGHDAVSTIHKTLLTKMHPEKEQFRTLRVFNQSKALFASLPLWAKIYIHGTVTIVKIAMG